MLRRTLYTQLIPLCLISALLLVGCATDQVSQSEVSINASGSVDTGGLLFAGLDQSVQDQIAQGERYEYWVGQMDPYITKNADWTYTADWKDFVVSTQAKHPEVYSHYINGDSITDDTVVIDDLINGLPIVNQFASQQYEEMSAGGAAPPPSVYGSWQWWGYKLCYTGSDAVNMIGWMNTGGAAIAVSGIGTVPGAVLVLIANVAQVYYNYYGGFCLNIWWSTNVTIGRP